MNRNDWKQFILAWALVALCAIPAMVWGQSLTVGRTDNTVYSVPACNTLEQVRDILSAGDGMSAKYNEYNKLVDASGEVLCGTVTAEIVVLDLMEVHTVNGVYIRVIRFQPDGYPKPLYGITTLPVIDAKRL